MVDSAEAEAGWTEIQQTADVISMGYLGRFLSLCQPCHAPPRSHHIVLVGCGPLPAAFKSLFLAAADGKISQAGFDRLLMSFVRPQQGLFITDIVVHAGCCIRLLLILRPNQSSFQKHDFSSSLLLLLAEM